MKDERYEIANAQGAAYAESVNAHYKTLVDEAYKELDELALACLAAGVPSSQILIRLPELVWSKEHYNYFIEAGISFKEDYRCVRNEDTYQ